MKHSKVLLFLLATLLFFSCNKKKKNIAIQPYGKIELATLKSIQKTIFDIYGYPVSSLKSKELPASAFINIKSPRYRADSIIRILKRTKPDSIDIVIGFTTMDISTSKKNKFGNIKKPKKRYEDWGIFGLGYRPGPSCVVSSFRLKSKSKKRTIERYKKVCVHEIGHNLGLKHCPDKSCVMTDACESINTVDNVKLALCANCKSQL